MGATPINALEKEAVDRILNLTHGKGTDRGCECAGYQCCDKHGHEREGLQSQARLYPGLTHSFSGAAAVVLKAQDAQKQDAQKDVGEAQGFT